MIQLYLNEKKIDIRSVAGEDLNIREVSIIKSHNNYKILKKMRKLFYCNREVNLKLVVDGNDYNESLMIVERMQYLDRWGVITHNYKLVKDERNICIS